MIYKKQEICKILFHFIFSIICFDIKQEQSLIKLTAKYLIKIQLFDIFCKMF